MKISFLVLFSLLSSFLALGQADSAQERTKGRRNSKLQQQKPYVILISADGFRYDYAEKFGAKNLLTLSRQGVKAKSLIPSFPSKTFPNHYTLATGLYPAHHGLINNRFYDPQKDLFYSPGNRKTVEDGSWYGGTPIWVMAEQQEMVTASFYWVGTEAPVKGIHPTYYYRYSTSIPIKERIQTVVNWLELPEEQRPHLITFYLPEVDKAGHKYGPDSRETLEAVHFVDATVKKLSEAVAETGLPVNFIFLSDHGMTLVDTINTLKLPEWIDSSRFVMTKGDILVELYAKDKKNIRKNYRKLKKEANGFQVYRKTNLPEHLKYGAKHDFHNRIGDIVLIAQWPRIFHYSNKAPDPGQHGYDPKEVKDMTTIFYAWGPAFPTGVVVPSFEAVQVFPIIAEILGLDYTHPIDGNRNFAKKLLAPR